MNESRRRFVAGFTGTAVLAATGVRARSALARASTTQVTPMSLVQASRQLAAHTISARQLVERSLAAIRDPAGEGARAFLLVHESAALGAADHFDRQRRHGAKLPPLAGIPVSIKDNFDEAGVVSLAGSTVLLGSAAALRDSAVVARLRAAGAILIGRTNMTEFAYSGLGINPHYGTPTNVFDRRAGRIPGGSSSGAAISVADGMAVAGIGTDTGGSVRIPAALNGLVAFKPTASRVPLDGVIPLSTTLDSAGPIARSVADCALLDQVLAGDRNLSLALPDVRSLRFAVPRSVFQDDLSPDVARAFASALSRLSAAGVTIVELPMNEFAKVTALNPRGALTSVEAWGWHRKWIAAGADKYDPRVIARILPGEKVTVAEYEELIRLRRQFIADISATTEGYDALLMPTTPIAAPTITEVARDDESYFRFNALMLRNPSVVNFFDGCALSIPCHEAASAPVGLMVAGTQNADRRILALGQAIESVVTRA